MRKLWLVLGIAGVIVAACSSPAPTPSSSAAGPPPVVFEPAAAAAPCDSGLPLCFPVGDFQHDVITPLTAAGYGCVPRTEGQGALCTIKNAQFYLQLYPYSADVQLTAISPSQEPDADTAIAQITTGLRAVLPLVLPKSPGAQQFFLAQLHTGASRPQACVTLKPVGHGYGITCLGRPRPARTSPPSSPRSRSSPPTSTEIDACLHRQSTAPPPRTRRHPAASNSPNRPSPS